MVRSDFVALILSHGRAGNVRTLHTLRRQGYDGPVKVVVDDTDPQLVEYQERFGDDLVVFSKDDAARFTDAGDNFPERRAVVYARNAVWQIARDLGYRYFLMLDDDYNVFSYRRKHNHEPTGHAINGGLGKLLSQTFDLLDATGFDCIAWAQGGDHIGGVNGTLRFRRKIMNSFFCDTEKPFPFLGKINEDTTTYCRLGYLGYKFGTVSYLQLDQNDTQSSEGGLTDIYLAAGTYVKSFYSVMYCPSFVRVTVMGERGLRLHHRINWNAAAPKIIHARHKKPRARTRPGRL